MNIKATIKIFILLLFATACKENPQMHITNLRCEQQVDPIGLDIPKPRLSWVLESNHRGAKQTAFQIMVSSSLKKLNSNTGDIWDSKKIVSNQTFQIEYKGEKLLSEMEYYWKMRVWDEHGIESDWTETSSWEMGLINQSDWSAEWINDGGNVAGNREGLYADHPAPLFRRDFNLTKKIKKARLYITGVGYYEATINGVRVGDHLLDPGWVKLKVEAPAGTRIKIRFGELLYENGTLNVMTSVAGQIKGENGDGTLRGGAFSPDTAWQSDTYITSGNGIEFCGIGWALAHPLLLLELYQYYGDVSLIKEQYETARKWFELVISENDLIITHGLSDHESLAPIPSPEMVTPLYYQSAVMMSELAKIIDREEDVSKYENLSKEIKEAYLEKFLDKGDGRFAPYTQGSQSFAVYTGITPKNEIKNAVSELVKNIEDHDGHLTTGIYGTKYSLDVLSKYGYAEIASKMVSQKGFPGWDYMLTNGATTLWETWEFSDNTYSHNHPMFGSVSEWFYKWVAGIQADSSAIGFDKITIRPQMHRTRAIS